MRRIRRAKIAGLPVVVFKPALETRFSQLQIVSHDRNQMLSMPVKKGSDIVKHGANADIIAIDEAQFFDASLPAAVQKLALMGKKVIINGLDMDYLGRPFGIMPDLMASADKVLKLSAICMVCGGEAQYTYRKSKNKELILLGETEAYEARCRPDFYKSMGKSLLR